MPDEELDSISVRFAWSPSEYGRALAAEAELSMGWRAIRRLFQGTTVAVLLGSIGGYLAGWSSAMEIVATMTPWLIFSALLWQVASRAHQFTPFLVSRRIIDREEERTLSALGLDVAGALDATFIAWKDIQRIVETDEFVLIMGGPFRTHFIPKRLLDPRTLSTLRRLSRDRLPPERLQLSFADRLPRIPAPSTNK